MDRRDVGADKAQGNPNGGLVLRPNEREKQKEWVFRMPRKGDVSQTYVVSAACPRQGEASRQVGSL